MFGCFCNGARLREHDAPEQQTPVGPLRAWVGRHERPPAARQTSLSAMTASDAKAIAGSVLRAAATAVRCRRANFAVISGLLAPCLIGLAGGAVDLFVFINHRAELQETADAAVLAAATEASLKGWSQGVATEVVGSMVSAQLSSVKAARYDFAVEVDEKQRLVDLILTQDHFGYFVLGYFTGSPQIAVNAVARASGTATICIIVQAPNSKDAFDVNGQSSVRASGCSAYSNSIDTKGLTVKDNSKLVTQLSCTAGGYAGKPGSYSPLPLTDCPLVADPLVARSAVVDASIDESCNFTKTKIDGGAKSLVPGTYCGGLEISKGARVHLEPGVYVIKDGKLKVDKGAKISGEKVAFVFSGKKAVLDLKNESAVSLSAPQEGMMAGILMYAQPAGKGRDFKIESEDAQTLIGTVYMPSDILVIGGDKDGDGVCDPDIEDDGTVTPGPDSCISDVGTMSSWTAIVVNKLKVTAGSSLNVNSAYADSPVPVPAGIGAGSSRIVLAR
jgi:hypothetical protein